MRRQAKPYSKEKRDEILDELSGSETDEEGEEDEDDDVVIDDYDCDDLGRQKKAPTLVDRAMQQLSLGKNYIVGGDTTERRPAQHHRKAVPMKRAERGFDDVLWRDDKSQGKGGNRKQEDPMADGFTKLIAFSESVKKIAHLIKKGNASVEELQTERLVARRLCKEIEVELRQMKPSTMPPHRGREGKGKRGHSESEEEHEGEDDEDWEHQKRTYSKLKSEFEKMKRKFDDIDQALREQDRGKIKDNRKPSASVFGELKVMDDYDSPPSDQSRKNQAGTRSSTRSSSRSRHGSARRRNVEDEQEMEDLRSGYQQQQLYSQKASTQVDMDKSLASLEGELEQLLHLFRDFNELVHAQQPMIDEFEEKVIEAEEKTKSAVTELATGASYGAYSLPLVGAAVGGLLFGPLGAIAGAKGAAAVGVCVMGGMGIGAYVGRQLSAKQKQDAALILERYRQQGQERYSQRQASKAAGRPQEDDTYSDEYDDDGDVFTDEDD